MTRTTDTVADKCKAVGRNTFMKIGNRAVGNFSSDDKRGCTDPVPFSFVFSFIHETPMPKRKSK